MLSIMRHDCMRSCCSNVFYVFRSRHFIRRLTKDFCSYTFHRDENDLLLALGNRQGDVPFDSSCHLPSSSCRFSSNSGRNAFPNESDSSGVNDVVDNSNNVVNESTYPFPKLRDMKFRNKIIKKWQNDMSAENWKPLVCTVCGQNKRKKEILSVVLSDSQLDVLRNDSLPGYVLPESYNLEVYRNAILHSKGLGDCNNRCCCQVCRSCFSSIKEGKKPVNSLANHQYYAWDRLPPDVQSAFEKAGLPADVFLVTHLSPELTAHLVEHPKIDFVSFTGSVANGKVRLI